MPNPPLWSPRFRLFGTLLQYKPFPAYYTWLDAVDMHELIANADGVQLLVVPFAFDAPFPLVLDTFPANTHIVTSRLIVDTAFDVGTLTVGEAGAVNRLVDVSDVDLLEVGTYETAPDYDYPSDTEIHLYLDAAGATQGAGRVVLIYRS